MNAVNARELWEKLGVATRFNDWIKRRIAMYDFAENSEWITLPKSEKPENKGFQEPIDYFISLDMAKELSMVENNAQGKIARRYFIECEKKMNGIMNPTDNFFLTFSVTLRTQLLLVGGNGGILLYRNKKNHSKIPLYNPKN